MLHLLYLLEAHVWYVLIIIGVSMVFFSTLQAVDAHKLKFEPRSKTKWVPASLGAAVLGLGILFFFFGDKLNEYPDIDGKWSYEVRNGSGQFSHKGLATIAGHGTLLSVYGTRLYTCGDRINDGPCQLRRISTPWRASWAQFCSDGQMRFDYTIDLAQGKVQGYCIISYDKGDPSTLTGYYYMLPPFEEVLLNARYGQIVFHKMKAGENILPPTREDVTDEVRPSDKQVHIN
jgi:hypothetical protein